MTTKQLHLPVVGDGQRAIGVSILRPRPTRAAAVAERPRVDGLFFARADAVPDPRRDVWPVRAGGRRFAVPRPRTGG